MTAKNNQQHRRNRSTSASSSSVPSATPIPRKRTHLKPSQLTVLQNAFMNNPLPDSSIRSRLAQELEVSERTVQIWFQNRRAKARKMEALSNSLSIDGPRWIEPVRQPAPPRYQPTFRTMMTPERFEELRQSNSPGSSTSPRKRPRSSSKPEPMVQEQVAGHPSVVRAMSEGTDRTIIGDKVSSSSNTVNIVPLPVEMLRIGTWTRFSQLISPSAGDSDLACYADVTHRLLTWQVQVRDHLFRIQVPIDAISLLRSSQIVQSNQLLDQIDIELDVPQRLTFAMRRAHVDQDWVRCGDFSEDKQASQEKTHVLQGPPELLKQAIFDLAALEPSLASKVLVIPGPPPAAAAVATAAPTTNTTTTTSLDLCREFTLSPSATPEPLGMPAYDGLQWSSKPPFQQHHHQQYHQPVSVWPTSTLDDSSIGYYQQMMVAPTPPPPPPLAVVPQQQQQQQHPMYTPESHMLMQPYVPLSVYYHH